MRIHKEIEIDIEDLKDKDLFSELEDRISYKYVLSTEEYQKEKEPEVQEYIDKLGEIRKWLLGY